MKKFFIFFVMAVVVGFTSCNKDEDEAENSGTPLIKTHIATYGDGAAENEAFEYDSKGRVVKIILSDGNVLITYVSDTQIKVVEGSDVSEYTLDANGRAVSVKSTDASGAVETYTFMYSGGFMSFEGQTTTVSNGNIVKEVAIVGEYTYETIYAYYTDKTNTIGTNNQGVKFMGLDNKNPVKTATSTSTSPNGTYSSTVNYTYEFDSKGRITKVTGVSSSPVKMQRKEMSKKFMLLNRLQNLENHTYTYTN